MAMVFALHMKLAFAARGIWETFVKLLFVTVLPVTLQVFALAEKEFALKKIPVFVRPTILETSAKQRRAMVCGPMLQLLHLVLQKGNVLAIINVIVTLGTLARHAMKLLALVHPIAAHLCAAQEVHAWPLIPAIVQVLDFWEPIVNKMAVLVYCHHPCQFVEAEVIVYRQTSVNAHHLGPAQNVRYLFVIQEMLVIPLFVVAMEVAQIPTLALVM